MLDHWSLTLKVVGIAINDPLLRVVRTIGVLDTFKYDSTIGRNHEWWSEVRLNNYNKDGRHWDFAYLILWSIDQWPIVLLER